MFMLKWFQLMEKIMKIMGVYNFYGEVLVFYLPIRFFYYLANLIIFTRSNRIHCILFLEGGFKGIYLREKILPFRMWFQRYEFLKDPPLYFMGEALGILYNQTFFCSGLEHLFIR